MKEKTVLLIICMMLIVSIFPTTMSADQSIGPLDPGPPSGPTEGGVGENYTFCIDMPEDFPGDASAVLWSWGDGTFSEWLGSYAPGEIACASHSWNEPGVYDIGVKLRNEYGYESNWSASLTMTIYAPAFKIEYIKGGVGEVCAEIKNVGEWNATNVNWSIDILSMIPGHWHWEGTISNLPVGESEIVCSDDFIVGLSLTTITVTADAEYVDTITEKEDVLIFLILVIIL